MGSGLPHRQDSARTNAQVTSMSSCILCGTSTAVEVDSSTAALWTSAKPLTLCREMCCGQCLVALVLGPLLVLPTGHVQQRLCTSQDR